MHRSPALLVPLAWLALAAPALAQSAHSIFHGPQGGVGQAAAYDEATHALLAAPPELAGVRLLPIEFHGHTRLESLFPGRPRWFGDVPGAGRLVLPGGRGGLYRYERPLAGGGSRFGFLHVSSRGLVVSLGERDGTGPALADDPYLRRVGVAPDGRAFLAGTTPAAGGDALEIELATGQVTSRTAGLGALTFGDAGLWLGEHFGLAAAREGVWRFRRVPGALAHGVPFEPAPAWYSGEVVTSPNGRHALTTAGDGPTACSAWIFTLHGPAVRAGESSEHLSPAGFLPDHLDGPYLAVSDGGQRAAWRREGITREAFLRKVIPAAPPAVHFTSDAYYSDTFDEVGVLSFVPGGHALRVGVGQRWLPGVGGLEGMDFFRVELGAANQPVFANLSGTGSPAPPFLAAATLDPHGWIVQLPSSGVLLFHDGDEEFLGYVDFQAAGMQVLESDVKDLFFVEEVGVHLALGIRRRSGDKPRQVLRAPVDLSGPPVVMFQEDGSFSLVHPVSRPDGWLAFFGESELGARRLHRLHLGSGQHALFPYLAGDIAPVMGLSPSGGLFLSLGTGAQQARFIEWPFGAAPKLLPLPGGPGHVLPGR